MNALELLLPEPLVQHNGPSTLQTTLAQQAGQGRWILHLLHFIPERRSETLDVIEEVIPLPDFGASSLGGVFHPVNLDQCVETVRAALDGGINFIDVSPAYGETLAELNLGEALRGIRRDQYYLATKVGDYSEAKGDYDYSAGRTERSLHESLERLGVDYVDLIHCHDIEFADHDQIVNETLPTLHRLKRQGLARFIGHHRPAAQNLPEQP